MKTIKFRAWGRFGDETEDHMVYDWQDSSYIEYVGFNGGDSFIIMQYTNLKDRNDVEIYDGDIVRYWDKDRSPGFVIEKVHWRRYEWIVFGTEWFGDRDMEVIGNIYQNPELLEES